MRKRLYRRGSWWYATKTPIYEGCGSTFMCHASGTRQVSLKGHKVIDLVFTKRKTPDSFTLAVRSYFSHHYYCIKELPRTDFMHMARNSIRHAIKKGYKYVHIELVRKEI